MEAKEAKKGKIIFLILILFISTAFFLPKFHSYSFSGLSNFNIEISPSLAKANSFIKAKIITYSFDINRSFISWYVNGKLLKKGLAEKDITLKTGKPGSELKISAVVITPENQKAEKTINVKVGDIDLLWEAETYTPPYYKGKALPVSFSKIKITAFPQGLGNAQNLVYTWKKNFKIIEDQSGTGQSTFEFQMPQFLKEETISLVISDINKTFKYEKSLTIQRTIPELIIYQSDPLEGDFYQKSIKDSLVLKEGGISLRAEPFFFNKEDLDSLSFKWLMNGKPLGSLLPPNKANLIKPQNSNGESIITISATNLNNFFQKITKEIKLIF